MWSQEENRAMRASTTPATASSTAGASIARRLGLVCTGGEDIN